MSKHTVGALRVFSGKCCLCDVGIPVGATSTYGDPIEIHTGDIVIIWHANYLGTYFETWIPTDGLTAVVSRDYQSFSDGTVQVLDTVSEAFAMGIKGCGFRHPEWRVQVVKKYSDVIPGEHWPEFGFSYAYSEAADYAIAQANA
ncbi:hypothetical protein [Pseudomonas aeruginosa]|uniref:hypothetical protein n=1 Tax=Pseudomonas aeruginosa TaxID=287 RepID=UPI0021BF5BD2|nr:hypothetical protein [Pseudomonas aeruginosa]UXH58362.1 hypothetical protein N5877_28065 [Pseudomonas aeruginosa]